MKLFRNASLPTSSAALKRVNVLFDETIHKISADEITYDGPLEETDLKGKVLLPGGIDAHCHLIAGKDAAKHLAAATKTAITGGWTTMGELSYFNPTPIFTLPDLKRTIALLDDNAWVRMPLWGNVDIGDYPYHAESALELWTHGVVGISLFSPSPNPEIPDISFTEIMELFIDIYESDTAFAFQGWDHENHNACDYGSAEDAIKKLLRRMQENPIHIPRVAAFTTIEFINTISKRSDISFSIPIADLMNIYGGTPKYLDHDLLEQKDLLFELLRTNKVYMLSNNAATPPPDKDVFSVFLGTDPALLKHSYLWVLSELWKKRKVPLATVIKMTSENAAKRLGLYPAKGCIDEGSDADFVIYDPQKNTEFTTSDGVTQTLEGAIDSVYLEGCLVASNGKAKERRGGFLARSAGPKRRYNNRTWI
jgi:dihydroorotase-like cyclic amidohydrolase